MSNSIEQAIAQSKNRFNCIAHIWVALLCSCVFLGCHQQPGLDAERPSSERSWLRDGGSHTHVDGGLEHIPETTPESTPESDAPPRKQVPGRGIILSSPQAGQIWATPSMRATMAETKSLGSNWSGYHPYARILNDGSLLFRPELDQDEVMKPMEFGRELGMKIFLVPHIAYWGSRFSWRGEITFQDEASWQRFFTAYKRWIVVQAQMAERGGAHLFSVGIEYKGTLHREKEWREVIQAVRKVYSGKITYAANWDSFRRVPFWDAVDFIGIQAYFPVAQQADPPASVLRKGWNRVLQDLETFSKKHSKSIVFTELGYNRSTWAGVRPWSYEQGGLNAEAVKLRCMRVALEAIKPARFIESVFLWKWFPDGRVASHDFIIQYPEMKKLIQDLWMGKGVLP